MWWDIIKSKWVDNLSEKKVKILEHKPSFEVDVPKMSYPDNEKEIKEVIKIMKDKPVPKKIMDKNDKDADTLMFGIVGAKAADYKDFKMDLDSYVMQEKMKYERPRPNESSKLSETKTKTDDTPAFPSGHATLVYALEKVLGAKHPNKSDELSKMAEMLALARVQMGSHYPSDIKAGKKLGYLIAKEYLKINKARIKINMPTLRQALNEIDLPKRFTLGEITKPLIEKYTQLRKEEIPNTFTSMGHLNHEVKKLKNSMISIVPRVITNMGYRNINRESKMLAIFEKVK